MDLKLIVISFGLAGMAGLVCPQLVRAETVSVCASGCSHTTIQSAINAAGAGDTVLVSLGTYSGGVVINKAVTLASQFINSRNQSDITNTIINGGSPAVEVATSGNGSKIVGFSFLADDKHIQILSTKADVLNNRFYEGGDCVSYEGGDGLVKDNLFENCGDDAVDSDKASAITIESNVMVGSSDDGIEIRLHDDEGSALKTVIRNNVINGREKGVSTGRDGRNGIQIMDQGDDPNRTIIIERNLITNQNVAGISLTCDCTSESIPSAIALAQPIRVYNNTLVNNKFGLAGGGNLAAINNVFYNNETGFLNKDPATSQTIIAYSMWNSNGTNYALNFQGVLDNSHDLMVNPQFAEEVNYSLAANSPAVNAGTINYMNHNSGENLTNVTNYSGIAPDLGWKETGLTTTPTVTGSIVRNFKSYLAAYRSINSNLDNIVDGIINILDLVKSY